MAQATYDDANLILRLYDLRREEKMRQAREWFGKSFHARTGEEVAALCPPGSEANAYYRMVVSYWDMAASFVTSGVLNEDLFYESGRELLFVWERVRELVPGMREIYKAPSFAKNLETVAHSFIERMNRESPGSYEVFSKMVRG
ncbi:MAG TPA: hypothetical protein VEU62_00420 [Bryobacterales bacterium]|nr:hypothetical protein [Bryobacterales bacterium]